ncbi:IclR family transcriptional regulator [Paraburkholderia sediminicola]|uniref:IclR family transcriptional regulator n=2 Tax=Burkholderiaceae TaxID=119060 RepID=UPI0038BD95B6
MDDRDNVDLDSGSRSSIKSLAKVLQVLECFSHREANLTPADIAARTGLPRATTHRLVSSLRDIGLLEQNGKRDTYKLGMKLFQLGSLVLANLDLDKHARPHATRLQRITGEAIHLCVFDGFQMAFVERQEMSAAANTVITRIESAPVYCTGVGKAFLAFQDEATIAKIIGDGLPGRTPHTLIDPAALREDLRLTQERGYAIDNEENEPHIRCVAAPIRDSNGRVIAAISVSGPEERMPSTRIEGLAPVVKETADSISLELGWNQRRSTAKSGSRRGSSGDDVGTQNVDTTSG